MYNRASAFAKCPLLLFDFERSGTCRRILVNLNTEFHESPVCGSSGYIWTTGRTDSYGDANRRIFAPPTSLKWWGFGRCARMLFQNPPNTYIRKSNIFHSPGVWMFCDTKKKKIKKNLRGLSPQANYTDRRLSAKLVPTFADRGCHVVSAPNPHGRILGFLDPNRYQNQPLTCHGTKDWHVWSDSCFKQDRLRVNDTGGQAVRKTGREVGEYWTESVGMWPEFIRLRACVINFLK
jgi:hypothetical protein